MRGRRRRRRSRPSSALSGPRGRLLGLACILALALPSVHCSSVDSTELKVVGSTNLPVKVYVKMNHNSPRILCITSHLRDSELIDPIFQWHGPGGDIVTACLNVPRNRTLGTLRSLRPFLFSSIRTPIMKSTKSWTPGCTMATSNIWWNGKTSPWGDREWVEASDVRVPRLLHAFHRAFPLCPRPVNVG